MPRSRKGFEYYDDDDNGQRGLSADALHIDYRADASGWHSVHNSQEIFCLLVLPRGRFFHLTTHYFTGGWASSPFPQILFVHSVWCLSGRVVVVGKTRRKDAILVARVFIMEIRLFEPQTGFLSSPPPVDNNNNNTREEAGIESEWDNPVNKTVFGNNSSERRGE